MSIAPEHTVSFAEYLELERKSEHKHEYLRGRIYAMAGGTPEHSRLAAKTIRLLDEQLTGRPCATFTSEVRIRVRETGLTTYPDVTVVCGGLERDPDDRDCVTNPVVLIEVLSKGTESHDREEKFSHYRRIPSLRCYVLIPQDERRVEVLERNSDETWTLRDVRAGDAVIEPIECRLSLDALYADPLAT